MYACAGCGGKLGVDVIQALDKQWHSKCFVCAGCSLPFDDGMFVAKEGKPYHKACAAKAFGAQRPSSSATPLSPRG